MDVDGTVEEIAKDVATQANEVSADEAAKEAHEEAARRSAGEASEAATGEAAKDPAKEEVVNDQPSSSLASASSRYLKVGDDLFRQHSRSGRHQNANRGGGL